MCTQTHSFFHIAFNVLCPKYEIINCKTRNISFYVTKERFKWEENKFVRHIKVYFSLDLMRACVQIEYWFEYNCKARNMRIIKRRQQQIQALHWRRSSAAIRGPSWWTFCVGRHRLGAAACMSTFFPSLLQDWWNWMRSYQRIHLPS